MPKENVPENDSPVSAYASAVRENAVAVMQVKVQYAKQVISEFLRVQSMVNAYTIAIAPFQEQARELSVFCARYKLE